MINGSGDIFVHDCDREIEAHYCDALLRADNFQEEIKAAKAGIFGITVSPPEIEEELKTATGIDHFVSYSMENVSSIMVTHDDYRLDSGVLPFSLAVQLLHAAIAGHGGHSIWHYRGGSRLRFPR